jgi:hypothetical protein
MPRVKTACESRMREICMSGLTRGGAGSGHWLYASHPVPPLLLYITLVRQEKPAHSLQYERRLPCKLIIGHEADRAGGGATRGLEPREAR